MSTPAARFIDFVNCTGSPVHSVLAATALLQKQGFTRLAEHSSWNGQIRKGGKYFVTRGGTTLMGFVVGKQYDEANGRCAMVGAHSDSPCLKLRPKSVQSSNGWLQVGVATYGGGLWHTWFDRGLGLAGRIVVQRADGSKEEKPVRIADPILTIPNLAIHLQSAEERKAFAVNPERHLQPVLCAAPPRGEPAPKKAKGAAGEMAHDELLQVLAKAAGVDAAAICDVDLCLFDAMPAHLMGVDQSLVSAPRVDNLVSTWACFEALGGLSGETPGCEQSISLGVTFDHEEVGSVSTCGADSQTLTGWLERIHEALFESTKRLPEIVSRSMLVSADGAHGLHPNYADKHQAQHQVQLGQGIVIKTNANQRYATTATTSSLVKAVCEKSGVPLQQVVVKNDSPCGSTIGPGLAARIGVRTVDLGVCQWAMHSARETCSEADCAHLANFLKGFWVHFKACDTQYAAL